MRKCGLGMFVAAYCLTISLVNAAELLTKPVRSEPPAVLPPDRGSTFLRSNAGTPTPGSPEQGGTAGAQCDNCDDNSVNDCPDDRSCIQCETPEGECLCSIVGTCGNFSSCPNGSSDCPAGTACCVNQCCGGPICVPICESMGACCMDGSCSLTTGEACEAMGGIYVGDGSECATEFAVMVDMPNVPIPDQGTATDTMMIAQSFIMTDVNVDLRILHTFVGDLEITIEHLGTSVIIVDRPNCGAANYDIILDDEAPAGRFKTNA